MLVLEQLAQTNEVLVTNVRCDAKLVFELFDGLAVALVQDFQGDVHRELLVSRLVHLAHTALTELANDREALRDRDVSSDGVHHEQPSYRVIVLP
jgi:hypothetical protein